jgi:hypothetical protein
MSQQANKFVPNQGERALIVGQTGSGKTAFACWLLLRIPHAPIFLYDTKEEEKFPKLPASVVVETMEQAAKYYDDEKVDYIIIRPPVEIIGKPELLDDMLFYHYNNFKHSTAYIDEAYTFASNGRAHKGMLAIYTRGRSRGITCIMSTQRPVLIPRVAITEAQKVFVFKLGDKRDRKTLSDVIPNFDELPLPEKHGFYFFESGEDNVELFKPIKLDPSLDTGYTDNQPEPENSNDDSNNNPVTKHIWI